MTSAEINARIREILADGLHLEDGEMMMPLKPVEIDYLAGAIRALVTDVILDATR